MSNETYLPPTPGGVWGISRHVNGRWITLIQDRKLDQALDALAILNALSIPATKANLDTYFPNIPGRGSCPSLALLELCNELDETNPICRRNQEGQVGV